MGLMWDRDCLFLRLSASGRNLILRVERSGERECFGFSLAVITLLFVPKPTKRGKCFPSLGSLPAFSNTRCRWNDGRVLLLPRVAQNPAAARFPLSVLKPQVFRPLRSAGFFDRAISPFFAKGLVLVFTNDLSG